MRALPRGWVTSVSVGLAALVLFAGEPTLRGWSTALGLTVLLVLRLWAEG